MSVVFQEGWETFTGTAGDNITDDWANWVEAGVNGGIEDARTGGKVETFCIAIRPSVSAPTNSYGHIHTSATYAVKDKAVFWLKTNEAGTTNRWAKFKLLNGDDSLHAEWDLTLYTAWTEITLDVSGHRGDDLKFCLEAGTATSGVGYAILFDDFRSIDETPGAAIKGGGVVAAMMAALLSGRLYS